MYRSVKTKGMRRVDRWGEVTRIDCTIHSSDVLSFRRLSLQGWDCHGLPIEVKALELLRSSTSPSSSSASSAATASASSSDLSPAEIRRLAKEFAQGAIEDQRASFKSWGILGSWSTPYITMNPSYESAQLGIFGRMVAKGLIYRGLKPVFWSPVSRTALAEAELEYVDDHVSPSLYLAFPITSFSASAISQVPELGTNKDIRALVWTTTPWTLPGNLALSFNPKIEYCLVRVGSKNESPPADVAPPAAASADAATDGKPAKKKGQQPPKAADVPEDGATLEGSTFLIGADRVDEVLSKTFGRAHTIVTRFPGSLLTGAIGQHPFYARPSPFLPGEHVTLDSGTAIVHTAPAHGVEDFQVCKANGVEEVLCPVDAEGTYTEQVELPELKGQNVLKGANKAVLGVLRARGTLIHASKLRHRFPYDWRSKTPVIQRATEQWFAKLDDIQSSAMAVLKDVQLVPDTGRVRLEGMIETRKEWCISRQRHWGVPIPVFYDAETDEPLLTRESVEHVQRLVEQHGTDCWWTLPIDELLPPSARSNGRRYVRGPDTMDVWFDSGCSWSAVLGRQMGITEEKRADVYLEGSDQYRGWFQSSLLTSVAARNMAPYKTIITRQYDTQHTHR